MTTGNQTTQYSTKEEHEQLKFIVYFCGVLVTLGFIAIVVQYLFTSAAATQSLSNEVQDQNSKIDTLTTIDMQILQNEKVTKP
jgi:hypothetical protein